MQDDPIKQDPTPVQNSSVPGGPQRSVSQGVQTPTPHVSSAAQTKEHEPLGANAREYLQPSEQEPTLPKEVAEVGVEVVPEKPSINIEHHKVGVHHAKESTPVITEPSGMVQLPMDPKQAIQVHQKNKNVNDSVVWLAELIVKHLKRVHAKVNN